MNWLWMGFAYASVCVLVVSVVRRGVRSWLASRAVALPPLHAWHMAAEMAAELEPEPPASFPSFQESFPSFQEQIARQAGAPLCFGASHSALGLGGLSGFNAFLGDQLAQRDLQYQRRIDFEQLRNQRLDDMLNMNRLGVSREPESMSG